MEKNDIQALIDFIAKSGLEEVQLKTDQLTLKIKRSAPISVVPEQRGITDTPVFVPSPPIQGEFSNPSNTAPAPQPLENTGYVSIKSPMIGTFYRASSPDGPLLVQEGDKVEKGQTVCVIEAMKLFNEIESDISGTVVKVLVDNAAPVAYDQPLFLIAPN